MARPVKTFEAYPLQVAIFQGAKGGYSVSSGKRQKNQQGQYETINFLFPSEVPTMAKLLDMAFVWCASQDRNSQSNGDAPMSGGGSDSTEGPVPF